MLIISSLQNIARKRGPKCFFDLDGVNSVSENISKHFLMILGTPIAYD